MKNIKWKTIFITCLVCLLPIVPCIFIWDKLPGQIAIHFNMNNIADKTTFWNFLGQTDIIIPKLQRDYAQGRKGKESLRENFLSSI